LVDVLFVYFVRRKWRIQSFCKQFLDGRVNVITDVFFCKRDGGNCALNDACCAATVNNCRNEIEQRKYIAVYAKSKYQISKEYVKKL